MSGFRKNRPLRPFTWLLLLGAVAFAAGCSTANTSGGGGTSTSHILPNGTSVAGWTNPAGGSLHASAATNEYVSNGALVSCTECHGADLTGGIARTSCFGNAAACHHGTIAGWFAPGVHGASAKSAPGDGSFFACQVCHGNDFSGGGAGIACALCHGVPAPHPSAPWLSGVGSTHTNTNPANAPVCAQCHFPGSANNPANHPPTPAPAGTAPGCFNSTLCHGEGGVAHPVPYNADAHYAVTTAAFPGGCSACHDVSAPTAKPGPACQTCHVAASPLTAVNCTSCHASPPSDGAPAGAAYPNLEGAHAEHLALNIAGSPVSCDTCHTDLGPSLLDLNHYNRAKSRVPPGDVAFLATYNAQSGASAFDNGAALNCSNVSCHGGQATPNWRTGAITVNTQCTSCHTTSTTAQFNGPTSGNHNRDDHQVACTTCHNTTALAVNHFTNLGTPALEGPASATIGGAGTAIQSWDPVTRSCNPTCHGSETW